MAWPTRRRRPTKAMGPRTARLVDIRRHGERRASPCTKDACCIRRATVGCIPVDRSSCVGRHRTSATVQDCSAGTAVAHLDEDATSTPPSSRRRADATSLLLRRRKRKPSSRERRAARRFTPASQPVDEPLRVNPCKNTSSTRAWQRPFGCDMRCELTRQDRTRCATTRKVCCSP